MCPKASKSEKASSSMDAPLVEVRNVSMSFALDALTSRRTWVLDHVSLCLTEQVNLGIVGPSGSGKSTLAMVCAGLLRPTSGSVWHNGQSLHGRFGKRTRLRHHVSMVFQNPFAALNPRHSIRFALERAMRYSRVNGDPPAKTIEDVLESVHLPTYVLDAYPGRLSGGECQRACIAVCLAANSRVLILDEPLSMLDPIVQEDIVELLITLREEQNWTFLMVTHDLRLAAKLSDRLLVLDNGSIVENASVVEVMTASVHPTTRSLLQAMP